MQLSEPIAQEFLREVNSHDAEQAIIRHVARGRVTRQAREIGVRPEPTRT